jgi:hypothetical protein
MDFSNITKSLEFVNKLTPVTFVDNSRLKYIDSNGNFDDELYNRGCFKGHRRIAGFIAQDVYQTMKDIYDDDNYASIVDYSLYDNTNYSDMAIPDRYSIKYNAIIPFLTGAIQELSKKLDDANAKITELENTISEMKNNQQSLNS